MEAFLPAKKLGVDLIEIQFLRVSEVKEPQANPHAMLVLQEHGGWWESLREMLCHRL